MWYLLDNVTVHRAAEITAILGFFYFVLHGDA
jgi:hypothetical protein